MYAFNPFPFKNLYVNQCQDTSITFLTYFLRRCDQNKRIKYEDEIIGKILGENFVKEYMLNFVWGSAYSEYVKGRVKAFMPPINNLSLVSKNKELKSNLEEGRDYVLISRKAWRLIKGLYGGGPTLNITKISANTVEKAESEVYKSMISVKTESDKLGPITNRNFSSHDSTSMHSFNMEKKARDMVGNPSIFPQGLANESYYCYLNSILQLLLSLEKYVFYFKNWEEKPEQSFSSAIFDLVNGHTFGNQIYNAKQIKSLSSARFSPFLQHDAFEFLQFLFGGVKEENLRASPSADASLKGSIPKARNSKEAWDLYYKKNFTIVDYLFGGIFETLVKCQKCFFSSKTFDPFLDLSLPIPKSKQPKLKDCINLMFQEETLKNSWICEKCKEKTEAYKKTQISRFPKYLIIQLKRFQYTPRPKKLSTHIDFPYQLSSNSEFSSRII